MASESNETVILDEIDRLFVSYEKAKEYLTKISTGINKHTDFWQTRRPMIAEQARSASMDFLLPRTQRMNELIIEAVQNLCRVDLLIEQVVRLEPKLPAAHQTRPMTSSFSSRSIDRVVSPSITVPRFPAVATYTTPKFAPSMPAESNPSPRMMTQPVLPDPVLKRSTNTTPAPPSTLSGRASRVAEATADMGFFQPIEQQSPYPSTRMNPAASADGGKVRVKLQRIASGTRWSQARIPVIDSLSAFYVQNIEKKAQDAFLRMITELDNHYNALEQSKRLSYIQDIAIGDFGVTRIGEDARWCRARVVSHEEDDRIRALDVDSGNLDIKFIDEFFPLDQRFVELPARAVACTLSEACPISNTNDNTLWLPETIEIFRKEVMDKRVEIYFVEGGSGADAWPLHFVRIFVGNQSVTNVLTLKQHIDPKPNTFIAEQLSATLTEQEYILFNVPMGDDVYKGS